MNDKINFFELILSIISINNKLDRELPTSKNKSYFIEEPVCISTISTRNNGTNPSIGVVASAINDDPVK